MSPHPALRAGALAFVYALAAPALAQSSGTSEDLLTGNQRLACEATLCLSSSLHPGECSPSLNHYFGIKIYDKGGLNWGKTVDARRAFLGMCPAGSAAGMPERLDEISRGAGKCDPDYLNSTYAGTAYKWRYQGRYYNAFDQAQEDRYEVHQIDTVTLNKLPAYCIAYNDHEWTYELSVKYVGEPRKGGRWIKTEDYNAAQAAWNADHGGTWAANWNFSLTDPRKDGTSYNNN